MYWFVLISLIFQPSLLHWSATVTAYGLVLVYGWCTGRRLAAKACRQGSRGFRLGPLGEGGGPLQAHGTSGELLYPNDSLVTVELRYDEAYALQSQADEPGLFIDEQRALHEQAWPLVRQGMEVVSRRHASDTLGFKKCRPDEVQYATHRLTSSIPVGVDAAHRARCLAFAATNAFCFGVSVAMSLARLSLYRLHSGAFSILLPPLAAPERVLAERFIFMILDYLASMHALTSPIAGEVELVYVVQQVLTSAEMEPSFRVALEARWTSPDVVAGVRKRGTDEQRTALVNRLNAESEAAQRADVVEHGLLVCALPGCDKQEATVREFKCVPRAGRWRTAAQSTGGCTGRGGTSTSATSSKQRAPSQRGRCEVMAFTPYFFVPSL